MNNANGCSGLVGQCEKFVQIAFLAIDGGTVHKVCGKVPLVVLVVDCEGIKQVLWFVWETQGVFEPLVEVGVEFYFVYHERLVYHNVAGLILAVFSELSFFYRVTLLNGELLHKSGLIILVVWIDINLFELGCIHIQTPLEDISNQIFTKFVLLRDRIAILVYIRRSLCLFRPRVYISKTAPVKYWWAYFGFTWSLTHM